jgi:quinol monooxygenase YgiN
LSTPALFIYWHAAPDQAAAAEAAARDFQAKARARHLGLLARLYRRSDGERARVTLMETYADPAGLPPDLAEESAQALAAWAVSGRHVERFEPAD